MFKHVIFDLDKTLVNLHVDWKSARKEVIEYAKSHGVDWHDGLSLWMLPFNFPNFKEHKKDVDKIFEKWESKAIDEGKPQVIAYAVELINKIDDKVIGVVSNNNHSTIERVLERIGIKDRFKYVLGRDDVFEIKPLKGIVEKAVEIGGVEKSETIFVGDSVWDFIAGSNAGVPVFLMKDEDDAKTLEYILNLTLQ